MALRYFENVKTKEIKRSMKDSLGDDWKEVIIACNSKYMILADPGTGRSKERGLKEVLTARARNHSRDVDLDETIGINKANGLDASVAVNLLNERGERRKKIDDV